MITASFGYAVAVSPLHTLMLYNAIANDGKMMKPYLVNAIKRSGIIIKEISPTVLEENISKPGVIAAARQSMEAVVIEGTAKHVFADSPFPVAGKTGTSHVAGGNIKYHHGVYQASFAGYFPADNPEYSCIVLIKTKPHAPMHYGGQLAAPVFKEVATKLYAMYVQKKRATPYQAVVDSSLYAYSGFTQDLRDVLQSLRVSYTDSVYKNSWAKMNAGFNGNVMMPVANTKKTMPDVQRMTLRDALFLLENQNMKVALSGRGKVVAQSVAAGTPIYKNQKVTLLLN
jgi:cell division protein FtsI (penicillin-binding protein 3)